MKYFVGLLAGVLNNKVSCRTSIVLGGSLSTVGFAAGAFVTSLDWMIVTCGVLVGKSCYCLLFKIE